MKVLVHIGGAQDGFNTPGSGEVRYAMNLAEMMAHFGHTVYCWGAGRHMHEPPQWGTQVPIPNVHFVMLKDIINEKFDLVLNCPMEFQDLDGKWQSCAEFPIEAPLKILTSFSWNQQVEDGILKLFNGKMKTDYIVGTPYRNISTKQKLVPHIFLPFPYFKKCLPINVKQRNSITWACKDVYSDDWKIEKEIHFIGQKCFAAIAELANQFDLTVNIITANTIIKSERAKRYGIPEIVESIKSKNLIDTTVPIDTMNDWLSKSRFSIILPGYAGSAFNAIADGCPTIFFKGRDEFTQMLGYPGQLNLNISTSRIKKFLSKFMNNNKFESWIKEQRTRIMDFSYANSYQQLMNFLKDYSCA